jgi:hypothetical protein
VIEATFLEFQILFFFKLFWDKKTGLTNNFEFYQHMSGQLKIITKMKPDKRLKTGVGYIDLHMMNN